MGSRWERPWVMTHPSHVDFQAVRDGECRLCVGPIRRGEWVRKDKRERVCHADCLNVKEAS